MEKNDMRRTELNVSKSHWSNLPKLAAVAILFAGSFAARSAAQEQGQKTFGSPADASDALIAALQGNDPQAILVILGPDAKEIVSSGDDTEDAATRANFVAKYQEMHRLVKEPDGTVTLYIGVDNWPTPIPLVNSGNSWYFDTASGKKEILYRRIGENEMSTISVCEQLVAAEKEYYSSQQSQYAAKILSDEGEHNGLYWTVSGGAPESPIGPLVAAAVAQGYTKDQNGAPTPYRGYYYLTLTRQGRSAPGGAKNYIVDGKMTGGFAFIAYPADYRSSGVMTFIVGPDGVVYQKDLGPNTAVVAQSIKGYDPNSTWHKADDQQTQSADGGNAKQ
jgi:hypothetical protein